MNNANNLRWKWINFFKSRDHLFLEPHSLVPDNDYSLLFINSGISVIKDYFLGTKIPTHNKLVNCQKVVRVVDIENIGYTSRHNSFFEMLGNFGISAYFKEGAISMAIEFLTKELNLSIDNLYFTIYEYDIETKNIYLKLGIPIHKLISGDRNRNFWDLGDGPCGPCTEIYYDRGESYCSHGQGVELLINDVENDRYIEIWNIVFSQYINKNGVFLEFNKNIDTGAGLERLLTIIEGAKNNFENSLLWPIILEIEKYSNIKYSKESEITTNVNYRIVCDHLRTVIMIVNDGIGFGNKGREYIPRKLLRRALMFARSLMNINDEILKALVNKIILSMSDFYKNLNENMEMIFLKMKDEKDKLFNILNKSGDHLETLLSVKPNNLEREIFTLVERIGIPYDVIASYLEQKKISFSCQIYNDFLQDHRIRSGKNKKNSIAFALPGEKTEIIYDVDHADIIVKEIFNMDFESLNSTTNQHCYLIFSETIFFPEIAGQKNIKGYINDLKIINVIEVNGAILHEIESKETIKVGDLIHAQVDTEARHQISANHTSEHLIFGYIKKILGDEKLVRISAYKKEDGFKLVVNIEKHKDLDTFGLIRKCELFMHEMIFNYPTIVKMSYKTPEECEEMGLDINKKFRSNKLRVISVGDINVELCIGTHVNNTSQIEDFLFTKVYQNANILELEAKTGNKPIMHFREKIHSNFLLMKEEIEKLRATLENKSNNKYPEIELLEPDWKDENSYLKNKQLLDKNYRNLRSSLELEIEKHDFIYLNWIFDSAEIKNDLKIFFIDVNINYSTVCRFVIEKSKILKEYSSMIFLENNNKKKFFIFGKKELSLKLNDFIVKQHCAMTSFKKNIFIGNVNKSNLSSIKIIDAIKIKFLH